MHDEVRYLTVAQAAAQLQTSEEMVRRMLRDGRLRGLRLGGKRAGWRLEPGAIHDLMRSDHEVRPGPQPRRAATAERPAGPTPERARELAARYRAEGDINEAEHWEQIAARVTAAGAESSS